MKRNECLDIVIEAINQKKDIPYKDRKLKVTSKLSKKDYFDSLDIAKYDWEYFRYFGISDLSVALYPTIRQLKIEGEVSYKELSNLRWGDIDFSKNEILIQERLGHSRRSIEITEKYYEEILNK